MTLAGRITFSDLAPVANHLWQSTLCVGIVWLATVALRKNRAAVRYWLWFAASAKFVIPFAPLVALGARLAWRTAPAIVQPQWSFVMDYVASPFAGSIPAVQGVTPHGSLPIPAILIGVWLCGFAVGIVFWLRCSRKMDAVRHLATPLALGLPIPALFSPSRIEPGVFGILRPVLLLPEGIADRLTPPQLDAILAHEMCHVRRRDNLTAAIHMFVETIFWFHPLVWWIRTRLVEERERACDEEVIRLGSDPETYAEGIIAVCKSYIESPVACVSAISGSDLRNRIVRIVTRDLGGNLSLCRKLLLAAVAIAAVSGPLIFGVLNAPLLRAQTLQSQQEAGSPVPPFEVASIKPDHGGDGIGRIGAPQGKFTATGIATNFLIMFAYNVKPFQISGGPSWLGSERFDIDAKEDDATATKQQALPPSERIDQIRLMLQSLLADRFKLSIHHTTTEVPIFSLVVTNPGRIPVSQSDCAPPSGPPSAPQPGKWPEPPCGGFFQNFGHIAGGNVPIDRLVSALSIFTGKIVMDNTGLAGKYNITLDWTPDPGQLGPSPPGMSLPQPDPNGPSLPTALEDQLGLKLISTKGPVDTLVIDHIEEPSSN